MSAGETVNSWALAWGLPFFSLGIFHTFPAQAQQAASTAKADPKHHHYKLIDTGTLGGATSSLGFEGHLMNWSVNGTPVQEDQGMVLATQSAQAQQTLPRRANTACTRASHRPASAT